MKKKLATLLLVACAAGSAFAGSSTITITPPVVLSWTQDVMGTPYAASPSEVSTLNSQLVTSFGQIQSQLNSGPFAQLHDLDLLGKGFANANAATFDNASLMGFQTYDLFAVMAGFNLGLAVPSLDPTAATKAINDIAVKGDVYAGLGTGGFAAQAGLNLGFLLPGLYGSAKLGFVPQAPINGVSYQQSLVGVGANYTLLPQFDFLFGFVKWRGVSVGSGLVFNDSTIDVDVPITDKDSGSFSVNAAGNPITLSAATKNGRAKLKVKTSSLVVPIDIMTSIQALWFVNLGLGAGCDLAMSGSQITLGAASDVVIEGINGATMTPGKVALTATDTKAMGDFFLPRLSASVGLDFAVFKIDVPMSYYPLAKSFSIGVSGGIVW